MIYNARHSESETQFEYDYAFMRRRASDIMFEMVGDKPTVSDDDINRLESDLLASFPADSSQWSKRDMLIAGILRDPQALEAYCGLLKREQRMLKLLETERAIVIEPPLFET